MRRDLDPIIFDAQRGVDVSIHPLFDAHIGSSEFKQQELKAYLDEVRKTENGYLVVGGDMMDMGLKHSVTSTYEQALRPSDQKRLCAELLEPLAKEGRILCGCSGNHEARAIKEVDDDPLYDVFCNLDIADRYRSNACFVFVRIGGADRNLAGKQRPSYSVLVTHGAGGGMYVGSSANRSERYGTAIDGLDLLITGHTHKPVSFPVAKLHIDPRNGKVSQKQFVCVTASSWLGYGGYPVRGMMPPAAYVRQTIHLSGGCKKITVTQEG